MNRPSGRCLLGSCSLAGVFLLDTLEHDGSAGLGLFLLDRQMTQHGVIEAEAGFQLDQGFLAALDVQQR